MLPLRLHVACLLQLAAVLLPRAASDNYNLYIDERLMSEPCDSKDSRGNVALSELLDAQLTTEMDADYETLFISGNITVKTDWPATPVLFEAEISRWQRGQWVPTTLALKRDDFCKALFDPFELWHLYVVTQVPKEQRVCPPAKGHVYSFLNMTNRMQVPNLPHWDIGGNLRAVLHFSVGELKTCALIYFTVSTY